MSTASIINESTLSAQSLAASIRMSSVDAVSNREELLIHRIRSGEKDLFYELVRPHLRIVHRIIIKSVRDEAKVEDVIQQSMIQAFVHFHQLRSAQFFRAWLIRIAINEARMIQRKERNFHIIALEGEGADDGPDGVFPNVIPDTRATPLEVVESKQTQDIFRSAIQCLPLKLREVVVLRHLEEYSVQETARMLRISISATKARLHRARIKLKTHRSIQNLKLSRPV